MIDMSALQKLASSTPRAGTPPATPKARREDLHTTVLKKALKADLEERGALKNEQKRALFKEDAAASSNEEQTETKWIESALAPSEQDSSSPVPLGSIPGMNLRYEDLIRWHASRK